MAKNNISGIQLKSTKSRYIEDAGESTRIDIQLGFREIHVCVKWQDHKLFMTIHLMLKNDLRS